MMKLLVLTCFYVHSATASTHALISSFGFDDETPPVVPAYQTPSGGPEWVCNGNGLPTPQYWTECYCDKAYVGPLCDRCHPHSLELSNVDHRYRSRPTLTGANATVCLECKGNGYLQNNTCVCHHPHWGVDCGSVPNTTVVGYMDVFGNLPENQVPLSLDYPVAVPPFHNGFSLWGVVGQAYPPTPNNGASNRRLLTTHDILEGEPTAHLCVSTRFILRPNKSVAAAFDHNGIQNIILDEDTSRSYMPPMTPTLRKDLRVQFDFNYEKNEVLLFTTYSACPYPPINGTDGGKIPVVKSQGPPHSGDWNQNTPMVEVIAWMTTAPNYACPGVDPDKLADDVPVDVTVRIEASDWIVPSNSPCESCAHISDVVNSSNPTIIAGCLVCPGNQLFDPTTRTCGGCGPYTTTPVSGDHCGNCPPGYQPGPLNSFNGKGPQNPCEPCPRGRFGSTVTTTGVPGGHLKSCFDCEPGTAMNSTGSVFGCDMCPPGRFAGSKAQHTCDACPAGKFAPSFKASACLDCGGGNTTETGVAPGATSCFACSPGQYLDSSTRLCTACTEGTYSATGSGSQCTNCSAGYFSDSHGQSACAMCLAGTYAQEAATTCTACGVGQVSKLEADPETGVVSRNASSGCENCAPGTHAPSIGWDSNCVNCAAGKGTINVGGVGASVCTDCEAGKFSNGTGVQCVTCALGRFQPAVGQSSCIACATPAPSPSATTCADCKIGYYNDTNGGVKPNCSPCPAGTYRGPEGPPSDMPCAQCPAGRVNSAVSSIACDLCVAGTFQSSTGQTACDACAAGFATAADGSSCVECTSGKFAAGASYECQSCETGRFSQSPGPLTSCSACAAGKFSDVAKTSCTDCLPGRFMFDSPPTSDDCNPCLGGRYTNVTGATLCMKCEVGHFQPSEAQTQCNACVNPPVLPPSYDPSWANGERCPCEPGYDDSETVGTCAKCEAGKFSADFESECTLCQGNTIAMLAGSTGCTPCNATGFEQANDCKDQCLCVQGMGRDSITGKCRHCYDNEATVDTYVYVEDENSIVVPAPLIQVFTGTECVPCVDNTIMPTPGLAECVECPPGLVPDTARTSCVLIPYLPPGQP